MSNNALGMVGALFLLFPSVLALDGTRAELVEMGQNFKAWKITSQYLDQDGRPVPNESRLVLIEPGIHRLRDGKWEDAVPRIRPQKGGAIADGGCLQCISPGTSESLGP